MDAMKILMQMITLLVAVPVGTVTILVCWTIIHPVKLGREVYDRFVTWLDPRGNP